MNTTLALRPTNWNDLPDIDDTEEITEADRRCLADLKAILERHGKIGRFGVTLLHSHFPLEEGEVFLEHNDPTARTLTSRPVKFADIQNKNYKPTVWRFGDDEEDGCSYCGLNQNGTHKGYKEC